MLQPYLARYLPALIYDRIDVTIHGWEFRRRRWYHDRLGDIFALVTPDEFSVWCADPAVSQTILQKRNEFQQAPVVGKVLGFLGPNVFMTNGDEWKRHRRMFNTNLDERISKMVWTESIEQAQAMVDYMVEHPGNETLEGLRSIAINIIGKAGYNWQQSWSPKKSYGTSKAGSVKESYFEMLSLVSTKILEAAFLPRKLLQLPFMSPAWRLMGYHLERAPRYIEEMLRDEAQIATDRGEPGHNFLSLMLQHANEEKHAGEVTSSLSAEEISGNLFVFTVAGFESTANTMGFTVILLALYPEWQDWIREEINLIAKDSTNLAYETTFAKCKRLLALMFETLRIFTPVAHSTRAIFHPTSVISSQGTTHHLTPPLDIYAETAILNISPAFWGDDALEFRPSRWIDQSGQLITPEKGTFMPWSGGPRVCPGLKMSEVEFVATMVTLFRSARCEPHALPGDGPGDPTLRLQRVVQRPITKMTLAVRNPEDVQLKWTLLGKNR
ncbi:hypothetical protein N7462_009041 [Penicillium macrosclerotiorum]|uniref:uncharacterized protein n=1 Tax=Penicillium macrosclerotiorum TaxID=303699 RepID=UPI002546CE4D|nr:uncharacterized protein N7462_009041 [Penicillium macrosclerotiorum]KAJ5676144.1 hypothetical protein N7462_009041 [Penicillium macrosclerotiorum]